jgi:outer membrane PBP1 activator LpoA protein
VLLAALAGCAPITPSPVDQPAEQPEEAVERAQGLLAEGRPLAAVRVYRDLAEQAEPPAGQQWRLRAVEVLFEYEYPELALQWHEQLSSGPIPPELGQRKQIVDAQAAVARRQGIRALRLLSPLVADLDDATRARVLATRADAYQLTGQSVPALQARIERESLLSDDDSMERNHEEIWSILQSVPANRLERMAERQDAPELARWAELGQAVREARLGQQSVSEAIERWRERFSGHPAAQRFAGTLRDRIAAESLYPERIALLLPLSGSLADAGKAVRDGLLASYYAQPQHMPLPAIEVYDTRGQPDQAARVYQQAIAEGASFVIGPLSKEAVAAVADRASQHPDVPILSLNYLPGNEGRQAVDEPPQPPEPLYQFGLLPEDEARQAAEAAIQNGHYNALTLVPGSRWGERMAGAFAARFEELGGVVLERGQYNAEATDYGRAIQRLFNLDASYTRERQLQSAIGQSVRFEPRRRQDVEIVFVAAMPRQARLIKPQLEFHRAGGLPTYTSSHIFSGTPNPDADWDMNGLYFTDTPWILENLQSPNELYRRITEYWPDLHSRYPRLYALGIDAFSILPHLERLESNRANAMAGRTGLLTLDSRRRVHRQLHWAQMRKGVPVQISRPGAAEALDAEAGTGEANDKPDTDAARATGTAQ